MIAGDIVEIVRRSRWGGIIDMHPRERGVLISRTYIGYDPVYSQWEVFIKGKIELRSEKSLVRINKDD
jgi:hypothetical protein